MVDVQVTSVLAGEFVLNVSGSLLLESCNFTSFKSIPVQTRGQVYVENSIFTNNSKGVFSIMQLGGNLTIIQSQFIDNAKITGAVLQIYPASGVEATLISISNCTFQGNGVKGGSSVLALSDFKVNYIVAKQTISFSTCIFRSHPAAVFQISASVFELIVSECSFVSEFQLLTGSMQGINVTMTDLAVEQAQGPLLVLKITGVFSLAHSNFTNIANGPLLTAKGTSLLASLVCLTHIRISNIANSDFSTYSNIINAQKLTIQLLSVHISNFTSKANGLFFLVSSVLTSHNFSALHGSAASSVIGLMVFCTISMRDSYFQNVNSAGTMWFFMRSSATIQGIRFREIQGVWLEIVKVYTTNLLAFQGASQSWVDSMDVVMINNGYPKTFIIDCSLLVTNSVFAGPMGMGLISVDNGNLTMRNITIASTSAHRLINRARGANIDLDQMLLRDLTVQFTVWSISFECIVRIQRLEMNNVTAPSFVKGQHFRMEIQEARIEKSRIDWIVGSGIVA